MQGDSRLHDQLNYKASSLSSLRRRARAPNACMHAWGKFPGDIIDEAFAWGVAALLRTDTDRTERGRKPQRECWWPSASLSFALFPRARRDHTHAENGPLRLKVLGALVRATAY